MNYVDKILLLEKAGKTNYIKTAYSLLKINIASKKDSIHLDNVSISLLQIKCTCLTTEFIKN